MTTKRRRGGQPLTPEMADAFERHGMQDPNRPSLAKLDETIEVVQKLIRRVEDGLIELRTRERSVNEIRATGSDVSAKYSNLLR